ncbi:MAG: heme biosynthesis HemY N-terminal domain-containing protein [Pseudomonadota bacterium]
MRRLLLLVVLMLLGGVGVIALIETDPGYVLVSYGHTTIETSLWVGLTLLFIAFALSYAAVRGIGGVLATRGVLSDWMSRRAYSRLLARCQMQLDMGEPQWVIDALIDQKPLLAQELRLLARARDAMGEWTEVIALLPQLRRQKVFGEKELTAFAQRAYRGLLAESDTEALKSTWTSFPAEQKQQPRLVEDYGRRLLESGDALEAEKVLARAIKRDWDGGLVAQYGRISGRDPARRLKIAERWLKQHSEDASLMLCLGRLCLHNQLWGKARDYFEKSHALSPNAEACAELARLLFSLGERELSAQYYREGLLLREANLPDLPQPKQDLQKTA